MTMQLKHLSFPQQLVKLAEVKASKYGLSFGEYVRHLVLSDVRENPTEFLTEEEEKEVGKSKVYK